MSQAPPDLVARVRTLEGFTVLVENILEWKNSVRLERADVDQLLEWSDRVLTATTVDEIFAD